MTWKWPIFNWNTFLFIYPFQWLCCSSRRTNWNEIPPYTIIYEDIDLFSVSTTLFFRHFIPCQFISCESFECQLCATPTHSFFVFPFFCIRLNHNRDKHLWWANFNLILSIFDWFLFYVIFGWTSPCDVTSVCFASIHNQRRFTLFYC